MTDAKQDKEKYARESFSWRRMTPGQVRAISIGAAIFVIALLAYGLM